MIIKCVKGCPFRMYLLKDEDDECFVVRSIMREHNCSRDYDIGRATQFWVAHNLKERVQDTPHMKVREMREER